MIAWLMTVVSIWIIISVAAHIISEGGYSPLPGAVHQKVFIKWSIIFSICLCIPFVGWLVVSYLVYRKIKSKKLC